MSDLGGERFEEFVHAAIPRLTPLARVLTRDPHDAADLVQETLIRVGLKWSSIRKDGNPHAYARTALVRTHLNARRRSRREVVSAAPPETPVEDASADVLASQWLRSVLATLPPRQRAVVALRYLEDMTIAQIAEALGCADGTARSQLHRALAALRVNEIERRQPTPAERGNHAD